MGYILGGQVLNIDAKCKRSASSLKPSWDLVLSYDFEFRKRFIYAFNNQVGTISECMKFADNDASCYQVHFSNQLAVAQGVPQRRPWQTRRTS